LGGFAYVEFVRTEDALRAVRQGTPHVFRYRERLVDVDFAPWEIHVGPIYCTVYISGWPASDGRLALLQGTDDIPNIAGATVCASFFPLTCKISSFGLTSCHMTDNSAAEEKTGSSQCVFAI
jgi:hypothetical protein